MTYTFGVDRTGLSFGGNPLTPGSSFGSIPTYANSASSVKPLGVTGGMDPLSAVMGIAGIGTSIAGIFGQKSAAEQQADAVEEAAQQQAAAVKQASKTGAKLQLAQFGLNYLKDRYEGGAGGALDRFNEAQDYAMRANMEANNPSLMALRSVERYDRLLNEAMPGRVSPVSLFA